MLMASLGPPADVDQKVLKTKTKTVYKWRAGAAKGFGVKVTVEDGVVVGWER